MKKIIIFAGVVIVLIAVIKIAGPVFTASVGNGETDPPTTPVSIAQSESDEINTPITIEIENETEPTVPETAEVSTEAQVSSEPDAQPTTAAPQTSPARQYKITPIDKIMYAVRSVNVRAGYSTDSEIVSGLKPGQEVHATGETENGWIRIDYTGKEAYVAKSYLSTSKADVQTTKAAEEKPTAAKPTATIPAASQPETSPAGTPPTESNQGTIAPFPGG